MIPYKTVKSDLVELRVVLEGGQIAPVNFALEEGRSASPYALAPWEPGDYPELPALLRNLRGDFFCFPFGVSQGVDAPHGETANGVWSVLEESPGKLVLRIDSTQPAGRIEKTIQLREGQRVLYQEHRITGVEGVFNYGHHPILEFPKGVKCPVRVSSFKFGQVYPDGFAEDAEMESSALRAGAMFESLESVELEAGGVTSLAEYPARDGFEDLVMMSAADEVRMGWTAISFPGFVWLSLRDTVQFPSTLFWISNGGRRQSPWNGRHVRRMGVEDVCSHFHDGAHRSAEFPLKDRGIVTAHEFRPGEDFQLRHVQMVVPVRGQPAVRSVEGIDGEERVRITFEDGSETIAMLDWKWLLGE